MGDVPVKCEETEDYKNRVISQEFTVHPPENKFCSFSLSLSLPLSASPSAKQREDELSMDVPFRFGPKPHTRASEPDDSYCVHNSHPMI